MNPGIPDASPDDGPLPISIRSTTTTARADDDSARAVHDVDSDSDLDLDEDDEGSPARIVEQPVQTVIELRSAPNAKRIRLDQFITRSVQNASRNKVQELIDAGGVSVNGTIVSKPGRLVAPGDRVVCTIPKPPPPDIVPEAIPLEIVFEDAHVLVVNKPAGMVTHPAFGNYTGTLVNALLWHTASLSRERGDERAGILHRLDKDTSGLLCVAKTDDAMRMLGRQFAEHTVEREYQAIAWGRFDTPTGSIDAPIARHRSDRKKMAVVDGGKDARTDYEVLGEFEVFSHLRLRLHTGRTHQIRVHCAHVRHPLLGDPTYGGRRILYGNPTSGFKQFVEKLLHIMPRQALHARTIGFVHPMTRTMMRFESPLPDDMRAVLHMLTDYYGPGAMQTAG